MANVIDVTFSGLVELRSAKYLYTANEDPDCWDAIFTNFGNSAYTFNSAEVDPQSIPWSEDNSINRNNTGVSVFSSSLVGWKFNNYRVRPTTIVLKCKVNGAGADEPENEFTLSVANSSSTYAQTLSSTATPAISISGFPITNAAFTFLVYNNIQEYVTQEIDQIRVITTGSTIDVDNLYVYGEIFREDLTPLPPVSAATTIEAFTDSAIGIDTDIEGVIYKRGLMSVQPNKPHSVLTLTMTGTVQLDDYTIRSIFLLDPNGANRIIKLPDNPPVNFQTRFVNLDGSFEIQVQEFDNTLIQRLSTAEGPLVLEVFWDGIEWTTTAM